MINESYDEETHNNINALEHKKIVPEQFDDDENTDYLTVIDPDNLKRENITDGENISKEVSDFTQSVYPEKTNQSYIKAKEAVYEEVDNYLEPITYEQPDVSYIDVKEQIYEEVDNYLTASDLEQTEPGYTALNVYHTEAQYTKINLNVKKSDQIKLVTNGTSARRELPHRRFGRCNDTLGQLPKSRRTDIPHWTQIRTLTTPLRRCIVFGILDLVFMMVLVAVLTVMIIRGKSESLCHHKG